MKDFDVTVKLRNNRLLERREKLGMSAPQLAAAAGISYGQYNDYEYLRRSPFCRDRPYELRSTAQRLCDFHGVLPEELWPEAVLKVRCSLARRKLDYDQVALIVSDDMRARRLLPDVAVEELEAARSVQDAVRRIRDPRDRQVIEKRFGIDGRGGCTLEEIAEEQGVMRERIRQREMRSLRRLEDSEDQLVLYDAWDPKDGEENERRGHHQRRQWQIRTALRLRRSEGIVDDES